MTVDGHLRETGISLTNQSLSKPVTNITFIMHDSPSALSLTRDSATSSKRRHSLAPASVRRPLRSSPLAGPALSREGLVIPDENAQGRPKPSRISSTPELASMSSDFTIYSADHIPPLPSSHSGIVTTPLKAPSAPSLHTPPPSPPSRPVSRGSTKSLPALTHATPVPPSFPRALHRNSSPAVNAESWLTANTYGETPRFSRLSMSNVVMPMSVKEHRRKSFASVKSSPLRDSTSSPFKSIVRTRSGSSGASSEEADTARIGSEEVKRSKIIASSLKSTVRKRASVVTTSSATQSTDSVSSISGSYPTSVTSFSSVGDSSDINSFICFCPYNSTSSSLCA
ncbi:hypothetical protein BT96DRAFT_222713 [Gymnopus androsaceus JB14]|uniref:Uncharacterized protein n=1 Tax=Gymnopus androsaceus JB14 TaxID=1447944 RepID=A0A6A4I7Q8_9AGAR|nr:hypothetical protein BT96DRAFT_222713 [Gymnopus androsaceus JB14]